MNNKVSNVYGNGTNHNGIHVRSSTGSTIANNTVNNSISDIENFFKTGNIVVDGINYNLADLNIIYFDQGKYNDISLELNNEIYLIGLGLAEFIVISNEFEISAKNLEHLLIENIIFSHYKTVIYFENINKSQINDYQYLMFKMELKY